LDSLHKVQIASRVNYQLQLVLFTYVKVGLELIIFFSLYGVSALVRVMASSMRLLEKTELVRGEDDPHDQTPTCMATFSLLVRQRIPNVSGMRGMLLIS